MERKSNTLPEDLRVRTQRFALRIINLVESLPRSRTADVLGKQLLRSGTSVGANYRSARRARSSADFVSKMTIVEEEADESAYWLELMSERKLVKPDRIRDLLDEAYQLVAIAVASVVTARKKKS